MVAVNRRVRALDQDNDVPGCAVARPAEGGGLTVGRERSGSRHVDRGRGFLRWAGRSVLALAMVAVSLVVVPATASHAAGTIALNKTSAGSVLVGGTASFTL